MMRVRASVWRIVPGVALGLALGMSGEAAAQQTASQQAAAQQGIDLKVGDRAPSFQGIADNGRIWQSDRLVGKKILVVYFYPGAMTAGCTKQACMFRDDRTRLRSLGAEVVGVSGDRVANLKAFKGANRLNFPLLADSAGNIARAFGVPVRAGATLQRTVNGREITLTRDLTTARWTFIIGRDGRIAFKETEVDPEGDSKAVIAAIQRMSSW